MVLGLGKKSGHPVDRDKAMKLLEKLGIATKPIEATQVEIRTKEKIIRVSNPEVLQTYLMGRDVYQVAGEVQEFKLPTEAEIKKALAKTGAKRPEIEMKLAELNYDLARAVDELKGMKKKRKV
jgi:NACalpha-BTF3-like transcription factor